MVRELSESDIWLIARCTSVAAIVVGVFGTVLVVSGSPWVSVIILWLPLIGVGWLLYKLASRAYSNCCHWEDRLEKESRIAVAELALLETESLREQYARKWFIRIIRDEERIREEFERRHQNRGWIAFLERHLNAGGALVLEWYARPYELLRRAKTYDATLSFREYQEAKLLDDLHLAGVKLIGQQDIELELEQMRTPQKALPPWEEVL